MKKETFDINSLRIASPCSVDWAGMTGDERTRFCSLCSLNVYNVSALTAEEVAHLVTKTEGRLCARMYRRADGSVITRDCPVGLRAYRKKASRLAGAALAAVIGLFSSAYGQTEAKKDIESVYAASLTIERILNKSTKNALLGTVRNNRGEIVPGAEIEFRNARGRFVFLTISGSDGTYGGRNFTPGVYNIRISAAGFKTQEIKELKINGGETAKLDITLTSSDEVWVTMGMIVQLPRPATVIPDLIKLEPQVSEEPPETPEKP